MAIVLTLVIADSGAWLGGVRPTAAGDVERPVFAVTTLDSAGDVGVSSSVAIGIDAYALISYQDSTNLFLKVAHCTNVACTSFTITTLDSSGAVSGFTSLAIGSDGFGLISYATLSSAGLKVAHCSNVACTSFTLSTIDSMGAVGAYNSVAIGADGFGLISYLDGTNTNLKVAHCTNVDCTLFTLTTIDNTAGDMGYYTSIAIGTDGLGLISYQDYTYKNLKVAHCLNVDCNAATFATIDSSINDVGYYTSLAIGSDGFGLISYYDNTNLDLKVAHCSNVPCNAATLATLDSLFNVGLFPSITIGADGFGLISYGTGGPNFDLKVAHCSIVLCNAATFATLDGVGSVGMWTSITMGSDGFGVISYYDYTNFNLKVAHCSNVLCLPYVRIR